MKIKIRNNKEPKYQSFEASIEFGSSDNDSLHYIELRGFGESEEEALKYLKGALLQCLDKISGTNFDEIKIERNYE